MFQRLTVIRVIVTSSFLSTACGGATNTTPNAPQSSDTSVAIPGLFDITMSVHGHEDVRYLHIDRQASVLGFYDYRGDEAASVSGNSRNCYLIESGTITRWMSTFVYFYGQLQARIGLSASEDSVAYAFFDQNDIDDDGDRDEVTISDYRRITGVAVADLGRCNDNI